MYNMICDIDLGARNAGIRRIPYAFNSYIEQLELPWDKNKKDYNQKRCDMNKSCLYWNSFKSLNDWNIIKLVTTKKHITEKDDEVFRTILRGVDTSMSDNILTTMYSAIRIDDKSIDEYYHVQ